MRLRGRGAEWNRMQGEWRFFPDAVGCIDGTPHEIYRPQVEPQAQLYSGHRHYHVMNTQLIVVNQGNIVFLQAGFLGSMNDAGNLDLELLTICQEGQFSLRTRAMGILSLF